MAQEVAQGGAKKEKKLTDRLLFEVGVQTIDFFLLEFFIEGGIDAEGDADVLVPHLIAGGEDVHTGEIHQCAEGGALRMGREGSDDHAQAAGAVRVLRAVLTVLDIQVAHVAFPELLPALLRHPFSFWIVEHV